MHIKNDITVEILPQARHILFRLTIWTDYRTDDPTDHIRRMIRAEIHSPPYGPQIYVALERLRDTLPSDCLAYVPWHLIAADAATIRHRLTRRYLEHRETTPDEDAAERILARDRADRGVSSPPQSLEPSA